MTTFLAPILEEWFFRGVLYRALDEGGRGLAAARCRLRRGRSARYSSPWRTASRCSSPVSGAVRRGAGDARVSPHAASRAEHRDPHVLQRRRHGRVSSTSVRVTDAQRLGVTFWTPLRVTGRSSSWCSVIYVTIWSLHPSLLVSGHTITGGDTGSHFAVPAYLRSRATSSTSRRGTRAGSPACRPTPTTSSCPTTRDAGQLRHQLRGRLQAGDHPRFGAHARSPPTDGPLFKAPRPIPGGAGGGDAALPLRRLLHHRRRQPLLDRWRGSTPSRSRWR
jgi:hypothetical protein